MLQTTANPGDSNLANFSFKGCVNNVVGWGRLVWGWKFFEEHFPASRNFSGQMIREDTTRRSAFPAKEISALDVGFPVIKPTSNTPSEHIIYYFVTTERINFISKKLNELYENETNLARKLSRYVEVIHKRRRSFCSEKRKRKIPDASQHFSRREKKILLERKLLESYREGDTQVLRERIKPEVVAYLHTSIDSDSTSLIRNNIVYANLARSVKTSMGENPGSLTELRERVALHTESIDKDLLKEFIKKTFSRLLIVEGYEKAERELIMKAYELALTLQFDKKRENGTPYFLHPLRVASMALQFMKFHGVKDANIIAAALLHDTVEDDKAKLIQALQKNLEYTNNDSSSDVYTLLGDYLNPEIASLVNEVTIPKCEDKEMAPEEKRNRNNVLKDEYYNGFRHASMGAHIIKLCDRNDNTMTLYAMPFNKRINKLKESLEKVIPAIFPKKTFETHRKLGLCESFDPYKNVLIDLHNLLITNLRFIYLHCEDMTYHKARESSTSAVEAFRRISSGDNSETLKNPGLFHPLISRDYIRSYDFDSQSIPS